MVRMSKTRKIIYSILSLLCIIGYFVVYNKFGTNIVATIIEIILCTGWVMFYEFASRL